MKKLLFFIAIPFLSFGQSNEFKETDSLYYAQLPSIEQAKFDNVSLSNLIEEKNDLMLIMGRFILDKKQPLADFKKLIPEEYQKMISAELDLNLSSYEDLELIKTQLEYLYKSKIVLEFTRYRNKIYEAKLDEAKNRLLKCLEREGLMISEYEKMSRTQKAPIQKRCFPEYHSK